MMTAHDDKPNYFNVQATWNQLAMEIWGLSKH